MSNIAKHAKYAWIVLAYNIFVIVYGGFVRATGSGAGCGSHWPTCNGDAIIPQIQRVQTLIELTHRLTSGLTLPLIAVLIVWIWRIYPKKSLLRWSSGAIGVFIITESLLGAGLVLFELVDQNASVVRAVSMIAHLINTFLLLGSIVLTAFWSSIGEPEKWRPDRRNRRLFWVGAAAMMLLGASGAIAALGDTLFPARSLLHGLQADIAAASNYLVRLRIFHPGIAILTGLFISNFGYRLSSQYPSIMLNKMSRVLITLVVVQIIFGGINVLLLAPIWMQLVHLLMTCLIWVLFLLTSVFGLVSSHLAPRVGQKNIDNLINQPTT